MTATLEQTTVTVSLEGDCLALSCRDMAERTHDQLTSGRYTWPCSIMPLPADVSDWQAGHRTARKRAWAAERNGYRFATIDRSDYEDDIFEINTSAPQRQGRPMSDGYRARQTFATSPDYPCYRHAICTYGILDAAGRLRAYTVVHRVGQLVMFSTIIGHADHLRRHVMYLLTREALADQAQHGSGFAFYNRHDSGTEGLRFFKERVGFRPSRVDWSLT